MTKNQKQKVLVKVYEPLIDFMERQFKDACLKRDAYLDIVFRYEAGFLREEVTVPNSDAAKNYIANNLKKLKPKPLNLLLSTETVELINQVCKEKNVPRDAFINRVFLLLTSSTEMIRVLFPEFEQNMENNGVQSDIHGLINEAIFNGKTECAVEYFFHDSNVLNTVKAFVNHPPLWLLRSCIDYINDDKRHTKDLVIDRTGEDTKYGFDYLPNKKINLYSYAFTKNALTKLPKEYDFIKTNNIIGFNTSMDDKEIIMASDDDELDLLNKLIDATNKEAKTAMEYRKITKDMDFDIT
jgi:hypothetical protein